MKTIIVITALALTFAGCAIGKAGKDVTTARSPAGAAVVVSVPGRNVIGELIALEPRGIVIATSNQLRLVPYQIIVAMQVKEFGAGYSFSQANPLTAQKRERLRLVSHFPQGLTPEIERRVLERLSQTAVDTVR